MLHERLLELHKDKFPLFSFLGQQLDHSHEEGLDLTVSNTASRVHSDDDFFEEEDDDDENVCQIYLALQTLHSVKLIFSFPIS